MNAIVVRDKDFSSAKVSGVMVVANSEGNWREVVAAYLARTDCMENSLKTYSKGLSQFFLWVESTGRVVSQLTEEDVLEWKKELLASGHSVLTVALYINTLKGFYKWAEGLKKYPNIANGVKAKVRSKFGGGTARCVKLHLREEQAAALLDYFKERNLRDYTLISLMLRTGIRSIEASRANVGDIKKRMGKNVLYVQGKGHEEKDDFVVLSPKVLSILNDYIETRDDIVADSPLFVCEGRNCRGRRLSARTIQAIGKEGMRAIGLDDHAYSIHSLRHTAGVQILKNGGTQFDVQDVLRHSSPVTSQIYLESIKQERRLESAPELILDKSFNE